MSICARLGRGEGKGRGTYRRKTEIAQRADACEGVVQKVGGLDVAVDDAPRVDVPQRAQQAAEVAFDAFGVEVLVEFLLNVKYKKQKRI